MRDAPARFACSHATKGANGPRNWMGSLIEGGKDVSGQMYRRNRYYDPSSGKFTQEDPIGLAGGLNTYGFANGDPVNYADPYGLSCEPKPECEKASATLTLSYGGLVAALGVGGGFEVGVALDTKGDFVAYGVIKAAMGWHLDVGPQLGVQAGSAGEVADNADKTGSFNINASGGAASGSVQFTGESRGTYSLPRVTPSGVGLGLKGPGGVSVSWNGPGATTPPVNIPAAAKTTSERLNAQWQLFKRNVTNFLNCTWCTPK